MSEPEHWPFVSVLVLNWNGETLLPQCLEALQATEYPADRWEMVVVDNDLHDRSVEAALAAYPAIRLHRNPANWGFARGYNGAIAAAPGEYVALLNLDARPEPGWLRALAGALEADPKGGAATAKLIYPPDSKNGGRIQNAGGMILANGAGRDRGTVLRNGAWI